MLWFLHSLQPFNHLSLIKTKSVNVWTFKLQANWLGYKGRTLYPPTGRCHLLRFFASHSQWTWIKNLQFGICLQNYQICNFLILKFIYSEKATKFCKISTLILSYVVPVKSKVEILQNFVAFSEYMNFTKARTSFRNGLDTPHWSLRIWN